jgi:pyruvate, water dikinase
LKSFSLKEHGRRLVGGLAIGQAIASGKVCVLRSPDEIDQFRDDGVLVTEMTDPDWVPIMKRAAAIVTDYGGRTSHAAIVSRELGLAAVVGTGDATDVLEDNQEVTISCAEGEEGHVYEGVLEFEEQEINLSGLREPPVRVMMNIASPGAALRWWRLPARGIGLARMEFIINGARASDARLRGQNCILRRPSGTRDRRHRRVAVSRAGGCTHERFQIE